MSKKIVSFIAMSAFLALPFVAAATNALNISDILLNIKNLLFVVFDGVIVIMFLWAGILYLTARGEPSQIQKANHAAIWGVIGTAVGILAYSIQGLVLNILGL